MLCVECGKREAQYENLCKECFLKKVKFVNLPEHMEIVRCPHCGAVKFKGEWKRMDEDEMVRELITRNMESIHEYESLSFDYEINDEDKDLFLKVNFKVIYKDLEVEEERYSRVTVKYESCPRCNKYFGNYFEAILQIRDVREGELYDVVGYAHEKLTQYAQKNENLFITKEGEKHGGWDIYISDKREAKKVADDLCRKYGATLKSSPHIVGRKDGKDVYRMTYSVRLPEYREGDVVAIENEYYLVSGIARHYIKLISLKDGREKSVDVRRHAVSVIKRKEDLEEAMVVFSRGDELQLMDKSYRTIEARTFLALKSGDKVKIMKVDGTVYVIP